jgi:sulfite exporter TauE/SafE/copper chaperone CopZ
LIRLFLGGLVPARLCLIRFMFVETDFYRSCRMKNPMDKITVPIAGMHCRSCEILVEEKLSEIQGVRKSVVSYRKGRAEIFYAKRKPDAGEIERAVEAAGYTVGPAGAKKPWIVRDAGAYADFGIALACVAVLYVVLRSTGLSDALMAAGGAAPAGVSVALLVGLAAGFSSCLALVGGLVLGVSARYAERHPEADPKEKFRPHLFFNAGRVFSYALLGGALGSLGSFLQLSGVALGVVMVAVGAVMLLLGLKLTGLFPRLESVGLTLPKGVGRALGLGGPAREYSHRGAFMLGALTFFLPCGFTQAMQVYAIGTGSFVQGALAMGLFALGTAPGLLGVGGLASAVRGTLARRFFVFSGVVVVLLALFNIDNGLGLAGWRTGEPPVPASRNFSKAATAPKPEDPNVKMEDGVQVVRMTEHARGYTPNRFTVRKGVPVRWVIDAQEPYSCASSLTVSKLGVRRNLVAGENVIEFTPKETGQIPFSCSMGMYRGAFTVVEE